MHRHAFIAFGALCLLLAAAAGCRPPTSGRPNPALLPREIQLHPFTRTWRLAAKGGVSGVEARVEAIDHFGDATKAFGTFRFEVFTYRPHEQDPAGRRLAVWSIDLNNARDNRAYWDRLSRTYKFRLMWNKPIPVGERFILRVTFVPPEGSRLFAEKVLVSGE